jgi:glycosyltransferase involved in cell wall biosynthesis
VSAVTVAIPVRDGGALLQRTLAALARQSVPHELLVCDSGSRDGSPAVARAHGARVLELAPAAFGHGATRNLLMREARGKHVALLTQDAEPADEHWLASLLAGFAADAGGSGLEAGRAVAEGSAGGESEAGDGGSRDGQRAGRELPAVEVALVYGPYLPRPTASPAVRLELERWFRSLSPDSAVRVERLDAHERALGAGALLARAGAELVGRRGFFTDANACIARAAWERVPFREVAYAEDRLLALDMLRAGYAKAYVPRAAVLHSHDYTALEHLRRCFDEWRALREVYGWREPASPRHVVGQLRGALGAARRAPNVAGEPPAQRLATLAAVGGHHMVRLAGAQLGSRAEHLPAAARRRLSLEGRAGFAPLDLDYEPPT